MEHPDVLAIRHLAAGHAGGEPVVAPMPRECFPTGETWAIYRETYDAIRVPIWGAEYLTTPSGSRYYNVRWLACYGWHFMGSVPDALQMARVAWALRPTDEHEAWLIEVSSGDGPCVTPETARAALVAWRAARDAGMPAPAACTGPDGQMFYAWDAGRHHLELEIIPGRPAEWFYRDRTREDGHLLIDYRVGDPIPAEVLDRMRAIATSG